MPARTERERLQDKQQRKISFNLDIETDNQITADAERRGISKSEWIRLAIRILLGGNG